MNVLRIGVPGPLLWLILLPSSAAAYQDDIGYTALQALLGAGTPSGAGVDVIHVEAMNNVDAWQPDVTHAEFIGKTFTLVDPGIIHPPTPSGHATGVGRTFYGDVTSIAPGIDNIEVFLADHWRKAGFLGFGAAAQPLSSSARVGNHSYVGDTEIVADDSNILRRLDWVIETDDAIHVVGMNNGATNKPLLGTAFNAIAVGRTDGNHAQGGFVLDATYGAGRTRPDLVAPRTTTSRATPVVAAAAALLVEPGHSAALGLSNGSTVNREGDLIYNAERSETVKAALMAGANRVTNNQSTAANITDYRAAPANQGANGLDSRFGAGQVNILNSYQIIAAGEQDSVEDDPGAGSIFWNGFDFDDSFGGLASSNTTATYAFTADSDHDWLTAALVWNMDIDGGTPGVFDGTATLSDLDLALWSDNGTVSSADDFLLGLSASTVDNSEHLWQALVTGHGYEIIVELGAGQGPIDWDYALAWQIGAAPIPIPPALWLFSCALAVLGGIHRRTT